MPGNGACRKAHELRGCAALSRVLSLSRTSKENKKKINENRVADGPAVARKKALRLAGGPWNCLLFESLIYKAHVIDTICQNPFAALSAGAKNG
jgi:hypothetical protein